MANNQRNGEHVARRKGNEEQGGGVNNAPDGTCARNLTCVKGSHDNSPVR